jgi:diguanylate cyclase (GGDEF)-like protein/PAS domain S-box-containing protein
LKGSEERFRRLAEHSPVGVYELSPDHRPVYVNPALLRLLEAERIEDIGERSLESFFTRESLEAFRRHHSMRSPGPAATYEVELVGFAGTRRTVLVLGSASYEGSGSPLAALGTMTDITDRKLAERALKATSERFKSLVQNASDLIMVVDTDGKFLYASPSMERLLGDGAGSLRGGKLTALLHPDDARSAHDFIGEATLRGKTAPFEARLRHCDGSWRVFEFVGADQRPNPSIGGFVLNAPDVTERRELEEQLRHQAFHDPLTGMANRTRLRDRLEHALGRASRLGQDVALIFMDLDDFKAVNDGYGHNVGDAALQCVATRVLDCLRPGDTAARLGGDEFAIVLEDSGITDGTRIAERIIEALAAPLDVVDEGLVVRASMGITVSAVSGYDADDLLRNADIAMYAAKSSGKARYEAYQPAMRSLLLERFTLLRDLERAIEQRELVVEYQPLIELDTRQIVGFEALVRWNHPRLGRLPPADFIGLAEESGLIVPLGSYVLEEACSQARRWQLTYPIEPPRSMSVNVSVKQLLHSDLLQTVQRVLAKTGLPPEELVLEVTESVMLDDTQSVIDLLHVIRRHGVRIAIDDFGTGYSSLSYLSRFPFDILKIDKSFIDQTRASEREGFLARAIIDIGKMFAVEVVAEGIEDVLELNQLKEFECKIGQGFLFAMPSPPAVIDDMLREAEGTRQAA